MLAVGVVVGGLTLSARVAMSFEIAVPSDGAAPPAGTRPAVPDASTEVKRALADATAAAAQQASAGRTADARKGLSAALADAAGKLPADAEAADILRQAVADAGKESDDPAALDRLQGGSVAAVTAIDFKPLVEAPMPVGFPGLGPVGKVVVKAYPAYRSARTAMAAGPDGRRADDGKPFWTLFRHIQLNEIKMTAPVEMSYATTATGKDRPATRPGAAPAATQATAAGVTPRSMAFLYPSQSTGRAGAQGDVEVIDVPAMTVASVGLRGSYDDAKVAAAVAKIDAWVAAQTLYERAGDVRLMGYNSPMIAPWLRFSEAQVPLRKR